MTPSVSQTAVALDESERKVERCFAAMKLKDGFMIMLDTGSATHLTTDRGLLDEGSIVSCDVEIVGIGGAKGAFVVKRKGQVTMAIGGSAYVLKDVLLAEGARIHAPVDDVYGPALLIGIRKLASDTDLGVMFHGDDIRVVDKDMNILASAKTSDDDLYVLRHNDLDFPKENLESKGRKGRD